jgi:hypothetical protein
MMPAMRLALVSCVLAAVGPGLAAPASATCLEHVDRAGLGIYSCSPPGGPVTTTV